MISLRSFANDVAHLSAWLLVLSLIFIPLERLWALHPQKIFRRAVWTDLGYYVLNSLAVHSLLIVPMAMVAWGLHAVVPAALRELASGLPYGERLPVAIVVGEFGCYWAHRWQHEVPFLWRFHAVHHSAEQIDWLVSSRAHPLDIVFNRLCGFVPLYVFGLAEPIRNIADPVVVAVVLVSTLWGYFVHANLRWRFGPLEWLVATPAFHHWHHTNDEHVNRNYSTMLPWMDRLFGTYFMPNRQWPARYGIDDKLPDAIGGQLLYPLRPRKEPPPTPGPAVTPG